MRDALDALGGHQVTCILTPVGDVENIILLHRELDFKPIAHQIFEILIHGIGGAVDHKPGFIEKS